MMNDEPAPARPARPSDLSEVAALAGSVGITQSATHVRRPADLLTRGRAAVVDVVAMFLISLFVGIVGLAFLHGVSGERWVSMVSILLLSALLLYTALDVFMAATPGKAMLDLTVTRRDGFPAPARRLVSRWAVRNGAFLLLTLTGCLELTRDAVERAKGRPFAAVVGYALDDAVREAIVLSYPTAGWYALLVWFPGSLLAAVPPRRQALHDLLTGTAVYRTRDVVRAETGRAFQPILGPVPQPLQSTTPRPAEAAPAEPPPSDGS